MYYNLNTWIEEYCPICGTHNYIRIKSSIDSWICWNCSNAWWIDDYAKTLFMLTNNVESEEADMYLLEQKSPIIFVDGQNEKD